MQLAQRLVEENTIDAIKSIYITFKQLGRFLDYDVFDLLGSHALSILDIFFPLDKFSFRFQPVMWTNGLVTGGLIHFDSKEHECHGYIDVNLHCPVRERKVIIYGEKGTIIYNPDSKDTLTLTRYTRTASHKREDAVKEDKTFHFDENHNIRNALQAFHGVIKNRTGDNSKRAVAITSVLEQIHNFLDKKSWCGDD
jgi:predicted dehydrogenase